MLQKASCNKCADITKLFEQDVARDLWGDARASYGAPTRRKKKRKTHQLLKDPNGMAPDLSIPMDRYPGVFIFYQMGRAGLLLGQPKAADSSAGWVLQAVADDARLAALHREHPGRVTAQFRHVPASFARMLAKIGYCQILTSLDPGDFDAVCLPYILGAEKNLSHIVGARASAEAPEPGIGYSLRSNLFGDDERCFVVAEIRLFAAAHTPTYHVVVGHASGRTKVELVSQKLEATYRAQLSEPFAFEIPPDELHWMPASWPIAG